MRLFILITSLFLNLKAEEYTCNTEYVIFKGKKYLPSENLKIIHIKISKDRNILVFKTKNTQSTYFYKNFIGPSKTIPSIGISFDNNKNFVDIFNNNILYLGALQGGYLIRAKCPSMNLKIREVSVTSDGKIVYGIPYGH